MKKKLLFINGHLNTGGVEKSLLDILRHLDYDRYDVDLLLLEEMGDYAPQLPRQIRILPRFLTGTYGPLVRCLLHCLKRRAWFSLRMRLILLASKLLGQRRLSAARKLLTGNAHYDCVIGFRSGICTQLAAFAVQADRRLIWWHHGELDVDRNAYLEAASVCDGVITVSHSCTDMLKNAFPALSGRITCIPNMLDAEEVSSKSADVIPNPHSGIRIVSVGRLAPEKHFENIAYAAAALKAQQIDFHWYLVGDGPSRNIIATAVKNADVEDRVYFVGNQPNPYPYLAQADLFVHPSYVESQGLTVLEAMALGIPCVVTKSRGPCEFIIDEENGLLTEQNPRSLADAVCRILADRELYHRIRQNTACPPTFSPEQVMNLLENAINKE